MLTSDDTDMACVWVWAWLSIYIPRDYPVPGEANMDMSMFEYFGGDGGHHCGYCKSPDGFVAPGMWAHKLTVHDLQVS